MAAVETNKTSNNAKNNANNNDQDRAEKKWEGQAEKVETENEPATIDEAQTAAKNAAEVAKKDGATDAEKDTAEKAFDNYATKIEEKANNYDGTEAEKADIASHASTLATLRADTYGLDPAAADKTATDWVEANVDSDNTYSLDGDLDNVFGLNPPLPEAEWNKNGTQLTQDQITQEKGFNQKAAEIQARADAYEESGGTQEEKDAISMDAQDLAEERAIAYGMDVEAARQAAADWAEINTNNNLDDNYSLDGDLDNIFDISTPQESAAGAPLATSESTAGEEDTAGGGAPAGGGTAPAGGGAAPAGGGAAPAGDPISDFMQGIANGDFTIEDALDALAQMLGYENAQAMADALGIDLEQLKQGLESGDLSNVEGIDKLKSELQATESLKQYDSPQDLAKGLGFGEGADAVDNMANELGIDKDQLTEAFETGNFSGLEKSDALKGALQDTEMLKSTATELGYTDLEAMAADTGLDLPAAQAELRKKHDGDPLTEPDLSSVAGIENLNAKIDEKSADPELQDLMLDLGRSGFGGEAVQQLVAANPLAEGETGQDISDADFFDVLLSALEQPAEGEVLPAEGEVSPAGTTTSTTDPVVESE